MSLLERGQCRPEEIRQASWTTNIAGIQIMGHRFRLTALGAGQGTTGS